MPRERKLNAMFQSAFPDRSRLFDELQQVAEEFETAKRSGDLRAIRIACLSGIHILQTQLAKELEPGLLTFLNPIFHALHSAVKGNRHWLVHYISSPSKSGSNIDWWLAKIEAAAILEIQVRRGVTQEDAAGRLAAAIEAGGMKKPTPRTIQGWRNQLINARGDRSSKSWWSMASQHSRDTFDGYLERIVSVEDALGHLTKSVAGAQPPVGNIPKPVKSKKTTS